MQGEQPPLQPVYNLMIDLRDAYLFRSKYRAGGRDRTDGSQLTRSTLDSDQAAYQRIPSTNRWCRASVASDRDNLVPRLVPRRRAVPLARPRLALVRLRSTSH